MNPSRRTFLANAGRAALGIGWGLPVLGAACNALRRGPGGGDGPTTQWAIVVDIRKCLNDEVRRACVAACRQVHNLPDIPEPAHEVKWIWSEPYRRAFPDQVHAYQTPAVLDQPVLVMCNHCAKPACVKVCPTRATWRRRDGIVMMDMHRCIGCRYCMAACPYGSRSFNWQASRPHIGPGENGKRPSDYPTRDKGVVEKCTFCAERIGDGLPPACVEAAEKTPGGQGALTFGNLADPDSQVSRLLRSERSICRRPGLGTGPNVFYIV